MGQSWPTPHHINPQAGPTKERPLTKLHTLAGGLTATSEITRRHHNPFAENLRQMEAGVLWEELLEAAALEVLEEPALEAED